MSASILTTVMKTNRIASEFPSAQVFFPFNEGSGNDAVCLITGATATDTGTADHNTPHAIELITAQEQVVVGLSSVKLKKHGIAIAVYEQSAVVAAISAQVIGSIAEGQLSLGATLTALMYKASETTGDTGGNAAQGDVLGVAIAWDDTNLYTYYGEDADLALVDTDALDSDLKIALVAGVPIANALTLNQAEQGALYGVLILSFIDALPSSDELIAGFNWMKDHWLAGDKQIYPPLADLV